MPTHDDPVLIHVLVGNQLRGEVGSVFTKYLPEPFALADRLAGATALVTIDEDVTAEMLDEARPSLRLIGCVDSAVTSIAPTDIPVVPLPRLSHMAVAEHTVAMILALELRLLTIAAKTARAEWVAGRDEPRLTDQRNYTFNWVGEELGVLYGKTVGIVGLGRIGRAVAERLQPFGTRLLYNQRHVLEPAEEERLGVSWRSFEDLLRESDVVTFHHRFQEGPEGNERQLGRRQLGLMKPTAYLVNTARGRLVDEDALVEALREGRIAGVALDVFAYEPLPRDHPLLELAGGNVILTAHVAGGSTHDYWRLVAEGLLEHLDADGNRS